MATASAEGEGRRGVGGGAAGNVRNDQSTSLYVSILTKWSTVCFLRSYEPPALRAERAWPLPCVLIMATYGTHGFHVPFHFSLLLHFL